MNSFGPPSKFALEQLRRLVYAHSAIVLDASKNYLFHARLGPVLSAAGVATFDDLIVRIATDRQLAHRVVEAMTTNETSFFRDVHPFDALRRVILPELAIKRRDARALNVWSAASSTGQELYSIAFVLKDMAASFGGWSLHLHGTDLSSEVVARAREGRYSALEIGRGLPSHMLARYFIKAGPDWQVSDEIRNLTEFHRLNLVEAWPRMPLYDVIFLRNVLIYFDEATRRRILDRVTATLRPGGYLFLGGVETASDMAGRLTPVQIDRTTCYRATLEGDKHVSVRTS